MGKGEWVFMYCTVHVRTVSWSGVEYMSIYLGSRVENICVDA